MRRLALSIALLFGVVLVVPALASAGTTYTNSPAWNGTNYVWAWGPAATETYGETVPGNGEALSSFTFHMDVNPNIVFEGAVATWDGHKAGTILWKSADMTTGGTNGLFTSVTFNVPAGIVLQTGQQYVIFATTVFSTQPATTTPNDGKWGGVPVSPTDSFPQGHYVYINSHVSSALTTQSWDGSGTSGYSSTYDVAFTATFATQAPGQEPVVMVCTSSQAAGADGSAHTFLQVAAADWAAGVNDPKSLLYQSTPAIYVQGYGTMCQLSDLVTYGGDPSKYADSGYTVNETGDATPSGISPTAWGSAYEYYARTG